MIRLVDENLLDNVEIWIDESSFRYEIDADDCVTMLGFSSETERKDALTGIVCEVMNAFYEWCTAELGYESYAIEAMIKDFLGIRQNEKIKFWNL